MNKQILSSRSSSCKIDFISQLLQYNFNKGRVLSRVILVYFASLFFSTSYAQDCVPALEWQRSLGGDTTDQAGSVINTSDGGYMVAGYTSSDNGDVSGNH